MVKPIRDLVLVKPFPSDAVSVGGIIVPDSCQEVSNKMEVVAVGNGTKDSPMRFKEGQIVFRVLNWGTEILIHNEKHYLMSQDSLLATLN